MGTAIKTAPGPKPRRVSRSFRVDEQTLNVLQSTLRKVGVRCALSTGLGMLLETVSSTEWLKAVETCQSSGALERVSNTRPNVTVFFRSRSVKSAVTKKIALLEATLPAQVKQAHLFRALTICGVAFRVLAEAQK